LVQSKGFIETFLANFGYEIIETQSLNDPSSYYHPTKSIIKAENKILGKFGQLNPLKPI
jgi:phenylalanyl-tRNA synthetase beta subunit